MLIIHTQTDKTEEKEKECRLSVVTFAQHESENNIEEFRQTRTRKQAESGGVGTQRTGKIEKESSLRKKQTVRKKKENELLKDTPNEGFLDTTKYKLGTTVTTHPHPAIDGQGMSILTGLDEKGTANLN